MKVVVIGAGPSATVYPHAKEIDSADKVVRVNYYEIKGYEDRVGTRTDIWITTRLDSHKGFRDNMRDFLIDWVPDGIDKIEAIWIYPRRGKERYGDQLTRILALRPDLEPVITERGFVTYTNKECGNEGTSIASGRPSSGTMAVFLAFQRFDPTEMLIMGFDAVLTDSPAYMDYYGSIGRPIFQKENPRSSGHHYDRERALIFKTAREFDMDMDAVEQYSGIVRFRKVGIPNE